MFYDINHNLTIKILPVMSSESWTKERFVFINVLFIRKMFLKSDLLMKKKRIIAILVCLLLIWIDQLTKYLFYNLEIWNQVSILEPLLNNGISRWISVPMVVIFSVSVICIWLFIYLFHKKYLTVLDFTLLLAWTLWNLIDRIWLGWVRDFLSFWSFPVFNIADSFLTCGVAWICIKEIFHLQKKEKNLP